MTHSASSAPRSRHMSRRRFITIAAAAGGTAALPLGLTQRSAPSYHWTGVALGANASLTIEHHDEREAKTAIEACLAEVARLERIFSLHMQDTVLSRLNNAGRVDDAPADLRILLDQALELARKSNGAFDPTVQPLWALYARHFSEARSTSSGPSEEDIAAARALVGWQNVAIEGGRIALLKPGMGLTLNGIAQGYITDKVGDVLRARGFEHVLINMGEQLALGSKWNGGAWRVGVADPQNRNRAIETIELTSGAVATSGGSGCAFDREGNITHILDPQTGRSAQGWRSVTVVAGTATLADGLSTALAAAPVAGASALINGKARAYVVPASSGIGGWL